MPTPCRLEPWVCKQAESQRRWPGAVLECVGAAGQCGGSETGTLLRSRGWGPTSLESTKAPVHTGHPSRTGHLMIVHPRSTSSGPCGEAVACGVLAPEPRRLGTQPRSPGGRHGARGDVRAESSGISSQPEGRGGNSADGTGGDVESELPRLRHSCQRGQGLGPLCWKRHPVPEPPAGNPPAASFHPSHVSLEPG